MYGECPLYLEHSVSTGKFNIIGIIPEGSISIWLLTRDKEKSSAQARRARSLLFRIPRVNNHVAMDAKDFIPFIT